MQAIVVDDKEEFASELGNQIREQKPEADVVPIPIEPEQSPRTIAAEVARQTGFANTVVFINVNLKCKDNARQDQAGVEVLKFLRLTERFDEVERPAPHPEEIGNSARDVHCILYSFQSVEHLLRERPSSLIICSDGVTFERLPIDFSELDLRALMRKTASPDDLDEFLRGEFTLPDERHSWANWWGMKQLYDVHRLVTDDSDLDYPEVVKKKLTGLQATEGASIYGSKKSELESELGGRLEEKVEDVRETLRGREIKVGHVDDRWEDGWSEIFIRMIYPGQSFRVGKNSLQDSSRPFANYLIGEEEERVLFRSLKAFGGRGVSDDIDEAYESIVEAFEHEQLDLDLLLLDLRLRGEQVSQHKVSELSGAKLLRKLRERFKGVPIIMTTASNKAWTYQKLSQVGADGYWIKEGLDERRGPEGTVKNYLEFLDLVDVATGERYQFLKDFDNEVRDLKSKNYHWWQHKEWSNGDQTSVNNKEVFRILDESILMLRSYLSEVEMQNVGVKNDASYKDFPIMASKDESFWVSSIIQQMANIVEVIHNMKDGNTSVLFRYERNDQIATYLTFVRNNVSHKGWFGAVEFEDLKFFAQLIMMWLKKEKYTEGVRGNWKSSQQKWTNYDGYTDQWGMSSSSSYPKHQLTRTYAQIYWWITQENPHSDQTLSKEDRKKLINQVVKILRKHKRMYSSQWSDIKSRLVDHNGQQVDIDAKLRQTVQGA